MPSGVGVLSKKSHREEKPQELHQLGDTQAPELRQFYTFQDRSSPIYILETSTGL